MNDYQVEKFIRVLEAIARSMAHIEKQLENLDKTIKPLTQCAEPYANGQTYFNISND